MMSKDKYLSIFSPQMEAFVFSIVQIIFATRTVLKIGGYSWMSPSFDWGLFSYVQKYLMVRIIIIIIICFVLISWKAK